MRSVLYDSNRRKRLRSGKSRKLFRKTSGTKKANISTRPMRGGFRI